MKIKYSFSKDYGIYIKWEDTAWHRGYEVDWDQLTPMEQDNLKCYAIA